MTPRAADYVADEFTQVLRHLIRAVGGAQSTGIHRAGAHMLAIVQTLPHCKEPIEWPEVFAAAVKQLSGEDLPGDAVERAYRRAALAGMAYLAELTAADGFAGGRASQRLQRFQWAVENIQSVIERELLASRISQPPK